MGIFKLFLRPSIAFFSILFIFCCKPKPKEISSNLQQPTSTPIIKKVVDSLLKYPEYLSKNYVLGKFDYTTNKDFKKVPKEFSNNEIFTRKETLKAFLAMQEAAKKDTISFKIVSGTRNFYHQKGIWNRKWKKYASLQPKERAKKILEYSSMPTTSRHHWGTDIDINNLNSSYFKKGKGKKEYSWLKKNASKFGFYQVYTSKEDGRTGYNEEEWHWSYAPLSTLYLNYYNTKISYKDISGFEGEALADSLKVIKNYVNGINPTLLNLPK